jgi:hypothetical protein
LICIIGFLFDGMGRFLHYVYLWALERGAAANWPRCTWQ